MAVSNVGLGYKTWCTYTGEALNSYREIGTVISNAEAEANYNHNAYVQKYFNKHWTGKGMKLTANGPATPIMLILSDLYQAETADIKRDFLALQPASVVGNPGFGTFTIQHRSELGQEAEAKKGVAKLMILCL